MDISRSLQRLLGVAFAFVLALLAGCPWPFDDGGDEAQPPTAQATIMVNKLPRDLAFTDQIYASNVSAQSNLGAVQYTVAPVSASARAAPRLTVDPEGRIAWEQVPAIAGLYEYSLTTIDKTSSASLATPFTIEVVATSPLIDATTTQTGGTVSDKTGTYRTAFI